MNRERGVELVALLSLDIDLTVCMKLSSCLVLCKQFDAMGAWGSHGEGEADLNQDHG